MSQDPFHCETIARLAQKTAAGDLTAVEVTAKTLDHIRQRDADLHAFARVLEDEALRQAAALDQQQAAGESLGPLHGVPIAVKDLVNTAGIPTACGTQILRDFIPDDDATVVTRLKAAGAVLIGKAQLTEGAWAGYHPQVTPPNNPWDRGYWAGASSSGSGVAVAAGLCCGAIGSDTGGSIRFPALCCGVVGLKPTFGRVSKYGAFPLADSLDHLGPMTRTVQDTALMLQAIAGYDRLDPHALNEPVPDYLAAIGRPLEGIKVGIDQDYAFEGVHATVIEMIEKAIEILRGQGAEIVEYKMPDCQTLASGGTITIAVEAALAHAPYYPDRKQDYGPILSGFLDLGRSATAMQYADLENARVRFRVELARQFETMDLCLAPVWPYRTPTFQEFDEILSTRQGLVNAMKFTVPCNYAGVPTITMPAGLDDRSMPQAFQLIGPRLGEAVLLQAAHAYETVRGPTPMV